MAAKKRKKTTAARKKAKSVVKRTRVRPCNEAEICRYLKELSTYLNGAFLADYMRLRNAVCNLDKVAIRGLPNNTSAMLCPGTGGGTEPPAPPKPPKW